MPDPPAILAERLTKSFRRAGGLLGGRGVPVPAIHDLDLALPRGALLGILGPNGAGKTTFLKLLATLLQPDSGRLLVDGRDCARASREVRARVGLVTGDERSFYWRLTGRQNLAFFAALHDLDRARARGRIDDLTKALGLGDVMDARVDSYSTGMRQRLGIARGLLHDPSVLLLDEPTRSLDPEAAASLRALIARLSREGGHTVVLVTHAPEEARALCTHLAMMREGALRLEASP
jgi:ABC-2 type transport system ATP-binding protein